MLILSVCASACGTERIILSAHADTLSMHLSVRWEYHALSAACWGAPWKYQRMLRVSYSQCHTLSVRWEHHSHWKYDTLRAFQEYDSLGVRVSYSQRTLRVWYSQHESIILSAWAETTTSKRWRNKRQRRQQPATHPWQLVRFLCLVGKHSSSNKKTTIGNGQYTNN